MIVVTGGAGFIGSNLVRALNQAGRGPVAVVDDLTDGHKFVNLTGLDIVDYYDRTEFLERLSRDDFKEQPSAILHQGACSTTTEWDGRYMLDNNYRYSMTLLDYCQQRALPLIYASSAAVYGASTAFAEHPDNERPLNVYGYSKLLFDQQVRRLLAAKSNAQVAGLRYFNVYGPNEQHKGAMASVAFHFHNQVHEAGECRLFAGSDGYGDGEQRRDFVFVDDVVKVNLWLLDNASVSGVFNVGSGRSQTFNDVADAVIAKLGGAKRYIPFPEHLRGAYQSFTEADLSGLRAAGYRDEFADVATGVGAYLGRLGAGQ